MATVGGGMSGTRSTEEGGNFLFETLPEATCRAPSDAGQPPAIPVVNLSKLRVASMLSDDEWVALERERDELLTENRLLRGGLGRFAEEVCHLGAGLRQLRAEAKEQQAAASSYAANLGLDAIREVDLASKRIEADLVDAAADAWARVRAEQHRAEAAATSVRRAIRDVEALEASEAACCAALTEVASLRRDLAEQTLTLEALELCCRERDEALQASTLRTKLASAESERHLAALVQTKLDLAQREFELLETRHHHGSSPAHIALEAGLNDVTAHTRQVASGQLKACGAPSS